MNWVDLLVVVLAVLAALSGYRQGMVTAVCSFLGVLGGAILGLRIAPSVVAQFPSDIAKIALGVAIVVLLIAIGETLGMWVGTILRERIAATRLTGVDNALGSVLQGVAVFVVAWLVALPFTSAAATPGLASAITRSSVLGTVNSLMPQEARQLPDELRQMLGVSGFPQALEPFSRTPVQEIAPPDRGLATSPVAREARSSVVKIRGRASSCARSLEGTGFVVAPHKVMTNAHVVAGTDRTAIEVGSGRMEADVVLYDPRTDLAVLSVPELDAPVLPLDPEPARSGDPAVALGYPLDGPYTASPARIRERINLRGPDIYDESTVYRDVYTVRARVQSGNSGGPLIDPQGQVVGVVFGAAVDNPETGFVLTGEEVADEVAAASRLDSPVPTGQCGA